MYLDTQEQQAVSGTQQQQTEFPLCGNLVHQEEVSRKCWRNLFRLAVEFASGKLVQTLMEKPLFPLCSGMNQKERDRDQNVVQSSRYRENIHKIFERKAEFAVRGEKLAQQRMYEAEAEVEVKHWEKTKSDIVLHEINQEYAPSREEAVSHSQHCNHARK